MIRSNHGPGSNRSTLNPNAKGLSDSFALITKNSGQSPLTRKTTVVSPGLSNCRLALIQRARLKEIASELQSLQSRAVDASAVKRLLADFDKFWETIPPREQVRLASLLIEKVDFDGVGGNIAITFHDTGIESLGIESLASYNAEALA